MQTSYLKCLTLYCLQYVLVPSIDTLYTYERCEMNIKYTMTKLKEKIRKEQEEEKKMVTKNNWENNSMCKTPWKTIVCTSGAREPFASDSDARSTTWKKKKKKRRTKSAITIYHLPNWQNRIKKTKQKRPGIRKPCSSVFQIEFCLCDFFLQFFFSFFSLFYLFWNVCALYSFVFQTGYISVVERRRWICRMCTLQTH